MSDVPEDRISESNLIERPREAAYTLTTYLESEETGLEFHPPSPFGFSAQLQRRPLSALNSNRGDLNLNHDGNWCPNSSEPGPCLDLDVKGVPGPLTVLELGSGTGIIIAKLAEIINKNARGGRFQFFFCSSGAPYRV